MISKYPFMHRVLYLGIFLISACLNIPVCLAKDIHFEISVDNNKVSLGSSIQLNLSFYGTQNMPSPDLGKIDGFRVRYLGPSTRISIVNGQTSMSITHIYRLLPVKTGKFTIGPFSIKYKGKTFTSNAINIEVFPSGYGPGISNKAQPPASRTINQEELKDHVFLTIEPAKTKVYLNEIIPLTIKLYVNRLAVRDIQYPKLKSQGFIVKRFDKPMQYRQTLNGILYDVIEFRTYVFPAKIGNLTLGQATVDCNLILKRKQRLPSSFDDFFGNDIFEDFFGTYEAYPVSLSSPKVSINVLPLPAQGRPGDFNGAVGSFNFNVEVSPLKVNVGDPITLKMKIEGEGNLDTVTAPVLESKGSFKVYEPEVRQENNVKTFTQVIIPQSEKIKNIPRISFSFFNPEDARYHTITKGPFSITVKPAVGKKVKITNVYSKGEETTYKEKLGKDILYIKESIGHLKKKGFYLYKSLWYWVFQISIFVIFLFTLILHQHRERLKTDTAYAQKLQAPRAARRGIKLAESYLKAGDKSKFFDAVFDTLKKYFKNKLHLYSGEITYTSIESVLRGRSIEPDFMKKLKNVFEKCEMARYASSEISKDEMEDIFEDVRKIIDYLEKKRI